MSASSFFIVLPSNVRSFADNATNKFRVVLPKKLVFGDANWICGLHSISYPNSWNTVGTSEDQFITAYLRSGDRHRIPVGRGSHSTPETLSAAIQRSIEAEAERLTSSLRRSKRSDNSSVLSIAQHEAALNKARLVMGLAEETATSEGRARLPDSHRYVRRLITVPSGVSDDPLRIHYWGVESAENAALLTTAEQELAEENKRELAPFSSATRQGVLLSEEKREDGRSVLNFDYQTRPPLPDNYRYVLHTPTDGNPHYEVQEFLAPDSTDVLEFARALVEVERTDDTSLPGTLTKYARRTWSEIGEDGRRRSNYAYVPRPALPQGYVYKMAETVDADGNPIHAISVVPTAEPEQVDSSVVGEVNAIVQVEDVMQQPDAKRPREDTSIEKVTPSTGAAPEVRDALAQAIRGISIRYEPTLARFQASMPEEVRFVALTPQLSYILGFKEGDKVLDGEVAKFSPDLKGGLAYLCVYTENLTEPIIFGDRMASLLRVVAVKGSSGDVVEQIYTSPIFCRVLPTELEEISIELRTMDNRLVPFNWGVTTITLLFKKAIYF